MPLMSARKNNDYSAVVSEDEVTAHLVKTVLVWRAGLGLIFLVPLLHHSRHASGFVWTGFLHLTMNIRS